MTLSLTGRTLSKQQLIGEHFTWRGSNVKGIKIALALF